MAKKTLTLGSDGSLMVRSITGEVQQATTDATTAYILLDTSGSMSGEKLDEARHGTIDFAKDCIRGGCAVGIISFSDTARVACSATRDLTFIADALQRLNASGSTNMTDAIEAAHRLLTDTMRGTRRTIVIVTDGYPDNVESAISAAEACKRAEISLITIGTGDADHQFLSRLASSAQTANHVTPRELARTIRQAAALLQPPK